MWIINTGSMIAALEMEGSAWSDLRSKDTKLSGMMSSSRRRIQAQRLAGTARVGCVTVLLIAIAHHFPLSVADHKNLPAGRTLADMTDLATCLSPAKARTAFPGTSEYESARVSYNLRYKYAPAAFVFPTSVSQVQNAVGCAVQLEIGITPRGGGHSYEDYSLGGRDGVIVVDMTGFTNISYNKAASTTTVGSGWRLGPLKLALWELGKVTIPSGICPTIGVGGHALGGGWSFTSRKFGILADNILEAQVVIANGSAINANANENEDLLWALKGAGANSFGIVTQFTFKVHDVSAPMTHFSYAFLKSQQPQTINAFQIWGQGASIEVSTSLYLDPAGSNNFYGIYQGPSTNLSVVLKEFMDNAPAPSSQNVIETDFITMVLIDGGFSQNENPSVLNLQGYTYPTAMFKAKSIFVKAPGFSNDGIQTFVNSLQAGPETSYFIFDLFGGQESVINQIAPEEGSWVHRDSLFSIQMFTYWQNNPSQADSSITFMGDLWNSTSPYASSEAYQNYIDKDMQLVSYYGSNLKKLITVKKKWDSSNIFNFAQSIPAS